MRPLLITDCDEVLLHMVRHFGDWLGEAHEIDFQPASWELMKNMRRRDGRAIEQSELFGFLDGFFPGEMARQTLVPHAREAPQVHRLHMVAEPALAPGVAPAPDAHARIDDWHEALPWIAARFAAGVPAEPVKETQA